MSRVPEHKGPAYPFWLRVQQVASHLQISERRLAAMADMTAMNIRRLKSGPPRNRWEREEIVRKIAAALNDESLRQFPDQRVPFPDDNEILALAGLDVDTSISVRDSILRSAEYSDRQKDALLSLLDVLDDANRVTPVQPTTRAHSDEHTA